jgi:putative transcription factor
MDCDMCGKPATSKAMIEGATMTVCDSCARFGTNVRPLPRATAPVKKKSSVQQETKEELIEMVRPDIARLLQQHRLKLKLNQEQFAAKLQIRASTYNHYESGAVVPDTATARKLEHVLKMPLVVHMKVNTPVAAAKDEEARGMTMADFMKKK